MSSKQTSGQIFSSEGGAHVHKLTVLWAWRCGFWSSCYFHGYPAILYTWTLLPSACGTWQVCISVVLGLYLNHLLWVPLYWELFNPLCSTKQTILAERSYQLPPLIRIYNRKLKGLDKLKHFLTFGSTELIICVVVCISWPCGRYASCIIIQVQFKDTIKSLILAWHSCNCAYDSFLS